MSIEEVPRNPESQPRKMERVEKDRQRVMRLYLEGQPIQEIALICGLPKRKVLEHLAIHRAEWKERYNTEYVERLNEELAKLQHLESKAWEAWYKSAEGSVKTRSVRERQVLNKGTKQNPRWVARMVETKNATEIVTSAGNPKYMEVIFRCQELRLRLTGFLDGTTVTNNNTISIDWSSMTVGSSTENGLLGSSYDQTIKMIEGEIIKDNRPGNFNPGLDPIEAKIQEIQPLEKPVTPDEIPLVTRRGREDDIMRKP